MDFVGHIYIHSLLPAVRRLVIGCLLLSLLLSIFSKAFVIVDFYANQDYIAKNLCVNRNKQAINCCGKCQLNRRLRQENKDSEDSGRKTENRNETISSRSYYCTGINPYQCPAIRQYSTIPPASPIDRPSTHFHPPDC